MEISTEMVRRFFTQQKNWAIPVGLVLLVLGALVIVTDAPPLAPYVFSGY